MTTTLTADVNATLQQIAELTASGCQVVRVAVPSQDDADALPGDRAKSDIPVIADIHFQPKYVFAAIDAGCAGVRVNPGNIKQFDDKVGEIAKAAGDAGIPIRIGVNAGSLDPRLLAKYGKATPEALVESALWECSLFEEHGFRDIKISVKHNDPVVMVQAYRQLAAACDYPLHLGVTEAGPAFQGTIKSAVAFGALLAEGIGDTIRVSLSAPPVEEVKVGLQILESLNLRQRGLEIVSCPSCGRAQVDVYTLAEQVTAGLEGLDVPLRVAVMGCVVNGPGEAREADLGVASGNGKGQIFVTRRGHQDRARVADRRDADRGGHAPRRADGGRRRGLRPSGRRRELAARRRMGPMSSHAVRRCGPLPLRVLDARDRDEVAALLARDPVAHVFVTARVRAAGLDPLAARAASSGASSSTASSSRSATPAPTWCRSRHRPRRSRAFAERARRQGRRCSSIVGPADEVLGLWELLEPRWGPARELRAAQPLHGHRLPAAGAGRPRRPPGPARRARHRAARLRRDVHRGGRGLAAAPATAARLPRAGRPSWSPRARVRPDRGRRGRLQGRDRRGDVRGVPGPGRLGRPRGCAGRGSAPRAWPPSSALCLDEVAPVVSLYVNDYNAPALRDLRPGRVLAGRVRSPPSCSDASQRPTVRSSPWPCPLSSPRRSGSRRATSCSSPRRRRRGRSTRLAAARRRLPMTPVRPFVRLRGADRPDHAARPVRRAEPAGRLPVHGRRARRLLPWLHQLHQQRRQPAWRELPGDVTFVVGLEHAARPDRGATGARRAGRCRSTPRAARRSPTTAAQARGFGLSVFLRDGDDVYRTYFTKGRGVDRMLFDHNVFDLVPYGRQEDWEDSPAGWPQHPTYG